MKYRSGAVATLVFDCQKNQILPKVTDQTAYYSRQLYIYNFAVVYLREDGETAKLFTWTENESSKSSNEICSALYHCLRSLEVTTERIFRLCCDGCPCQNKNSAMVYCAAYWLVNDAPLTIGEVQLIFLVVGHSFLPPDRVFGRIEKLLKRMDTIIAPQTYHKVFKEQGSLYKLGVNCPILDWREAAKSALKSTASFPFKISKCKRLCIRRHVNYFKCILHKE